VAQSIPLNKESPMPSPESALFVQQAIQLSVAPVFLLTGIAGLLGVMANRLARTIDRAREVGRGWSSLDAAAVGAARLEVANLERRRNLASWAINLLHRGCPAGVHRDRHAVH